MSNWPSVRLAQVATHIKDGTHGTHLRVESGVPLLSAKNVGEDGRVRSDRSDDKISRAEYLAIISIFQPRRDDLLLTIVGSIGRSALFDGSEVAFQRSVAFVRPGPDVLPSFLHQASKSVDFIRQLERRSNVTAQAGLYLGELAKVQVPLPPMQVQQRIACILASLDSAVEATEALIGKYWQIRAGLMHTLFTRGVGDDGTTRQDGRGGLTQTPLGLMPAAWRPSTVGRSFDIDSGITLGPHRRPARRATPYLRVANVHRDELRLDDIAQLEALAGDETCALRVRDLLVVEGHANPAEIGRCAMVTEAAVGMLFQNHLFRLRAQAVSPEFGLLWLNSFHMQRYWERTCSTSSGLNTINRRMLNAAPLYVPSVDEQARIVAVASAARAHIDSERATLAKLRMQKQGLMQDLLTGKVRVSAD